MRSLFSRLVPPILGLASVLWGAAAHAQSIGLYMSPPGEQTSTRTGAVVENFSGPVGSIGASGNWAIGSYTAATGLRSNADQYGGAGGSGQYLAVKTGPISVTLSGERRYVGFWWSAGDPGNEIRFYDRADNLLATFTTATLMSLLSGTGTVTAIDGNQYPKAAYLDNPNARWKGLNKGQPYAYINLLIEGASTTFGRIEMRGANYELDNLAIVERASPSDTWVDVGKLPVTLPPDALIAVDDTATGLRNGPIPGNVTTNDTGVTGSTVGVATPPAHGSVVMQPDGNFIYTPDPTFAGTDTFTYAHCKPAPDQAVCATATVTVSVVPDAVDDAEKTDRDVPLTSTVAGNDVIEPGATFTTTTAPGNGTVVWGAGGSYTYTPAAGFTGTDTFTYQVCLPAPNQALCDTATVTIVVAPPGEPPVATEVTIQGTPNEDQPITGRYVYSDPNKDVEHESTYRWITDSGPTLTGGGTPVGDSIAYTPTTPDVGRYLFYCVTPVNQVAPTTGAEVCSPGLQVQAQTPPVVTTVTITGVPAIGTPSSGNHGYTDSNGDPQGPSTYRWVTSTGNTPTGGTTVAQTPGYTPTPGDDGRYLFLCVTPQAATGIGTGAEVCSAGVRLTSGVVAVPTLSQWSLWLLSLLTAAAAAVGLRRRG
jgi:hypothetical protein